MGNGQPLKAARSFLTTLSFVLLTNSDKLLGEEAGEGESRDIHQGLQQSLLRSSDLRPFSPALFPPPPHSLPHSRGKSLVNCALTQSQDISSIATSLQCIPLRPLHLCHQVIVMWMSSPFLSLHFTMHVVSHLFACIFSILISFCFYWSLISNLDLESIHVSAFFLTTHRLLKCYWRNSMCEWSYTTPYAWFQPQPSGRQNHPAE